MAITNTEKQTDLTPAQEKARELRPDYFDRIDSLLASGAFTIEDRRLTHPPTGRRYAD